MSTQHSVRNSGLPDSRKITDGNQYNAGRLLEDFTAKNTENLSAL